MSRSLARWIFVFFYVPFVYHNGVKFISRIFVDLPSFYWAAYTTFVLHGSPYRDGAFHMAEQQLGHTVFPYIYWPPSLLFFYPATFFTYDSFKIVSLVVNHLLLLFFLYFAHSKLFGANTREQDRIPASLFLLIYPLFFFPVTSTLYHGQVNLVLLASFCVLWYGIKRPASLWLVAIPLAFATWLKMFPAVFLVLLLAKRKFAALLVTIALLAGLIGLSALVLPSTLWQQWYEHTAAQGGYGRTPTGLFSPASPWNQSLNGFTSRLFLENDLVQPLLPSPVAALLAPHVLGLVVLALTLLAIFTSTARHGDRFIDEEFSLLLLAVFLVLPFSWEHHLVLALPAAFVCFDAFVLSRHSRGEQAIALAALFLLAWEIPFDHPSLARGMPVLAISIKTYAVAALWCLLALRLRRAGDRTPVSSAS